MKRNLLILIFCLFAITTQANTNNWINVQELGVKPDGKTLSTKVIQKAIDNASKKGGGVIYFPAGKYLTGALHLKSNITLHLDAGSVLKFSDNPDDYLPFVEVRWEGVVMQSFSPLLHAVDAENITIEGRGVLDGQGKKWWDTALNKITEIKKNGEISSIGNYEKMWEKANEEISVSDYYQKTLKRRFFRPPFIQANRCKNIRIVGVKIINSPFWTINPIFCDNIIIDGVTINNPISPNTDGINPSSCSNVHISNCHITVGDDCITIKSGRDEQGRKYAIPCQNITITNCTMLNGHGGVVIGSEMSGCVRKITIANCVFDGTDRGIRLKSSRERGGIVEEIRVDNILMKNIQREAFMFNLKYDKKLKEGPVSEKTPKFRNIHISNVTGTEIKQAGRIIGIPEMPIENISFSNMNLDAQKGFEITTAFNIEFHDITINTEKGSSFIAEDANKLVFENVKSNRPHKNTPIVLMNNIKDCYLYNCFQLEDCDSFLKIIGEQTENINIWGNTLNKVITPYDLTECNREQVTIK